MATRDMRTAPTSPEAARRQAEIRDGLERGTIAAEVRDANPQVTGFSQLYTNLSTQDLRKVADLHKRAGRRADYRERDILTDPDKRMRKLAVETGYDIRSGEFLSAPLEPWTGPAGSDLLYGQIMRAPDGATRLADYPASDMRALEWMRTEELITIGPAGTISALSDLRRDKPRSYPGAPCSDALASLGRSLMDLADEIMLQALFNLSMASGADTLQLSASQICAEANRIKAARPDLRNHRFLSLSTARGRLRNLKAAGKVVQLAAAKAIRRMRSWFTLPAVIAPLRRKHADVVLPSAPPQGNGRGTRGTVPPAQLHARARPVRLRGELR